MYRLKPSGIEYDNLVQEYKTASHNEKLSMSKLYGVSLGTLSNWVSQKNIPQTYQRCSGMSWDGHLEVLKQIQKATDSHFDIPVRITIEIDTDKPVGVCFSSDWQLGEQGVDYVSFGEDIEVMSKTEGLKVAVGGDGYSNIIQPAKIGSSHNQAPIVIQKAFYYQTLELLVNNDKCLFVGTGNHNWFSTLMDGEDWDLEVAKGLNVVYTKHGALVYLKVGDMVYPIFRQHKGRWNSAQNLTNTCKQYQRNYFPEARIVVVEHDHVAAVEQYTYDNRECVAIRTGTYAVMSDFAQSNGFYGARVENPVVVLYPHEDKIVPFKNMTDGITYLTAVRAGQTELTYNVKEEEISI